MTNDKENAWFYGLGAADFQHKIRARVGKPFSKTIDGDELERVMPMLVAARPFFMFPESFSPTDIRDLLAAVRSAVPEEDGHIVGRITELFHPDMNYSDIEKAIRELLGLHASLRGATVGRPPWIGAMVDYCSVALWVGKKTQLEKDAVGDDGELHQAERAAGVSGDGYTLRLPDDQPVVSNISVLPPPPDPPVPVSMLLYCPMCHSKHIDEGEFATKPHHSHACQAFVEDNGKKRRCGHVWRPAIVPTVGVEALPGFINETVP